MYEKFRFSMNGFLYCLIWIMFNLNVTCGLCPTVFNGGFIDPSCASGMVCNYYCNPGFVKTNNELFCVEDEYWFPYTSSACIMKVPCPALFNNGYIKSSCSRLPGDLCTFYCDPGFVKKGNKLTCGKRGMWIPDTNSICIKSITCPDEFNGGYIEPYCSRHPGDSCPFYCYPKFVKKGYWLTCGNNGSWIQDTNSVCIKSDPCPDVVNGGYVDPSCSRVPGVSCTFNCNPGFVKKGNLLTCGNYGNWLPDTNSICVQSVTCPDEFNGGYIEPYCSRHPGDSCPFYCYPKFVKKGYWLTCGNNGSWIQDTNSVCIQSVKLMPSYYEPRPTGPLHVGAIVGISTAAFIIVMIIIVSILVWRAKRVRKSQRVPGHAGDSCLRTRENRDQNLTTLRQHPNADVINSVSSFESPSYNGIYFDSFDQRIPTTSGSCMYPEPPPSYSETQMATNEAPPTYIEAIRDPTRFNLYI
ncbi:hypothetical protein ACJMK2_017300 [Sinanodonta woodiana]|uniref:Sushi domain-containing protein n=1 Tax=Sinanodonta woodiana TaxID=1069815 RepID=A0ABD3UWE7_SINWO